VLPGHPGSERRSLTFPPASPASKSYSSCESVRANLSCPKPTADPLLSFRLSRAFSYHAQSPRPARATRARTCLLPRRFGNTTQRTLTPSEPGEPTSNTSERGGLVDSYPIPFGTGLHRLSAAPLLPWPWTSGPKPLTPDLRSFAVRGKRRFSEEIAFSSEVSQPRHRPHNYEAIPSPGIGLPLRLKAELPLPVTPHLSLNLN